LTDFFLVAPARVKRVGETKPFTIDLKTYLRSYWIAGRRYAQNDTVRSPSVSGFAFQAGAAGEAGPVEPAWPRVLSGTCQDGSIPWTAIAPGSNAVDTISGAPVWSQINPPDAALTIGTKSNTIEEATAAFSAGTAGAVYRINCAITTTAANVYVVQFNLEVA
jgi:hypothetical protein